MLFHRSEPWSNKRILRAYIAQMENHFSLKQMHVRPWFIIGLVFLIISIVYNISVFIQNFQDDNQTCNFDEVMFSKFIYIFNALFLMRKLHLAFLLRKHFITSLNDHLCRKLMQMPWQFPSHYLLLFSFNQRGIIY